MRWNVYCSEEDWIYELIGGLTQLMNVTDRYHTRLICCASVFTDMIYQMQ